MAMRVSALRPVRPAVSEELRSSSVNAIGGSGRIGLQALDQTPVMGRTAFNLGDLLRYRAPIKNASVVQYQALFMKTIFLPQ